MCTRKLVDNHIHLLILIKTFCDKKVDIFQLRTYYKYICYIAVYAIIILYCIWIFYNIYTIIITVLVYKAES